MVGAWEYRHNLLKDRATLERCAQNETGKMSRRRKVNVFLSSETHVRLSFSRRNSRALRILSAG